MKHLSWMVERVVTLQLNEQNECGDSMIKCCKESAIDACGVSNPEGLVYNVQSNVTYAKFAEFPWTVVILQRDISLYVPDLTIIAGGALIHPKFVLTAAHALKDTHRYLARFGEWNLRSSAEIYPRQDIHIEEFIIYPSYRDNILPVYDVALGVLRENVVYSEHIRPLCLPNAQDVFEGQRCIESGWGLDVRTGQPPTVMKRMELKVISRIECQLLYQLAEANSNFRLHRNVMCATALENQNAFIRDGGTPLACQRADGSYALAGITAWGGYNGQTYLPIAYTDVAKFASWINGMIDVYDEENKGQLPG
uniref:Peptidase S1 domain-containing protein n=1 Tax=Anopheles minimus TaxID=112268 RepID=A0A3F2Z0Z0_9DIPT